MPLAPTTRLSPNFTAFELGADQPGADARVVANLTRLASDVEVVRGVLGGGRLQVNTPTQRLRGFRPDAALATDSPTTSHADGDALDFVPLDFQGSRLDVYNRLKAAKAAGQLRPFDQIIFYPVEGHIHYGRGPRMRGEFRIKLYEGQGGTPLISAVNVKALGDALVSFAKSPLALLLLAVVAVAIINR